MKHSAIFAGTFSHDTKQKLPGFLIRHRTTPTKRPMLVGEF
jgi:hypothetical protein